MKYILNKYNCNVADEALIEDMRRTARRFGKIYIKYSEYAGDYHPCTISARFGGWNAALSRAGLIIMYNGKTNENELMHNLKKVWDSLDRQPKYGEMVKPISRYSAHTYALHFGSWRNALAKFVLLYNNEDGIIAPLRDKVAPPKRKRFKYITKSMRFDVLKRDNFKCRACGHSPADDPKVKLQVDHIIPVSKGGETILSNLQTLCRDCNIGKTNKLTGI